MRRTSFQGRNGCCCGDVCAEVAGTPCAREGTDARGGRRAGALGRCERRSLCIQDKHRCGRRRPGGRFALGGWGGAGDIRAGWAGARKYARWMQAR